MLLRHFCKLIEHGQFLKYTAKVIYAFINIFYNMMSVYIALHNIIFSIIEFKVKTFLINFTKVNK